MTMTMKRTIVAVFALWVLVLAILVLEKHRLADQRVALELLRSQKLELQSQLESMTKRTSLARRASVKMESAASLHIATPKDPTAGIRATDFRTVMARSSELRSMYLKGMSADLYTKWGLLFKELGLTPEQAAKFVGIQVRLEEARLDLVAQGIEASPAQPNPAAAAEHEAAQEIRDLIGNDNYATYKAYNQESGALTLVSDLPHFSVGDMDPLTQDQALGLAQILANASDRNSGGKVIYGTVDWQAAMPAAQAILAPSQFVALQLMESEKLVQWQMEAAGKAP